MKIDFQKFENNFSMQSFLYGLSAVVATYGAVFVYAAFQGGPEQIKNLQARLASQSVIIDYIQTPPAPVAIEPEPQNVQTGAPVTAPVSEAPASEENDLDVLLLDQESNSSTKALIQAPVTGLYEDSKFGKLPIVKADGKTPFTVYKKPFLLNRDHPAIAIAVLSYGLSPLLSEKMLRELPPSVTFILNPYTNAPDEWQKKARTNGHEIWMQLMFENSDFPKYDPGAMGLMSDVSMKFNQDRLLWTLGRTAGYAGIAAFTDETLEKATPMFTSIANDIFSRGLGYFELSAGANSFIEPLAVEKNTHSVRNFITLDDLGTESEGIKAVMQQVQTVGGATIVIKPTPINIDALKIWIQSLEDAGIHLVPVSALAELSVSSAP
jgi:polysaccharide deacetylase 2 family uncharacterized protein YibQ